MVDRLVEVKMCCKTVKNQGYNTLYNANLHRLMGKMPIL